MPATKVGALVISKLPELPLSSYHVDSATVSVILCRWTRVVAVVGAGHLPGMRAHWDTDIDLEDICTVPENMPSRIKWGRLAVTAVLTGSCLYYGTVARRR